MAAHDDSHQIVGSWKQAGFEKKKQDDSDVNWRRVGTEIYFLWIWFGDG